VTDLRNAFVIDTQIQGVAIAMLDASGNSLEEGTTFIDSNVYSEASITSFTITPSSYVTGERTDYTITLTPSGFVPRYAEINFYYPDEVYPYGSKWLKNRCGQDTLEDFNSGAKLTCRYR
jgi:hypothetical protein